MRLLPHKLCFPGTPKIFILIEGRVADVVPTILRFYNPMMPIGLWNYGAIRPSFGTA
ncbi:MAG: hypothetical protein JWQ71_4797 [Pedosphaera sp.]|nr:hypothetical protein [Pedosphaera sp.]